MADGTGRPEGWRKTVIRIFLCLGLAAILSQFFRSATGVIAPDLMRDLSLSASQMGMLTAAFFFTFALTQIPTGILLDRYGSRLTIAGTMLFAVAGSFVFYLAETYWHVVIARTLIGIGCAGVMMGAFSVLARWFDARSFTMTIGWMIALSNGGNLLATTPMAMAAEAIGWRGTYLAMGLITLAVVGCLLVGVRDAPPGHGFLNRRSESGADILAGLKAVFRNPQLPYVLVVSFVTYACTITVFGLWAAPFLHDVYGLDGVDRGNILLGMSIAIIAGTLIYGPLDRKIPSRRRLVLAGGACSTACLALLAVFAESGLWLVAPLMVAFTLFNTYNVLTVSHGRTLFADHLVGRGMTTVNIAVQTGAAVLQLGSGVLIGLVAGLVPGAADLPYRVLFGALAIVSAVALAYYARAEDRIPTPLS
ncbi:MFS transporter [Oceanibaculum pacificum]|uniref:Major facilitator superfamily (MFS) profile domain-containing protein n=1 Tax=Oceanibaculum pacificum TaxID=580166 RepID=A0A154VBT0_9PROT|nr:MFS transporter [Oceanibaculum pacificum]KZC98805.1 hypothetical protein AUP43_14755 [Oceanibaculum pacificum]